MPTERDPDLDHWWTPAELADRWRMDVKTARAHLRRINTEAGSMLFRDEPGARVRIHGRVLESAIPGVLTGGRTMSGLQRVEVRLDDVEEQIDTIEGRLSMVIAKLTA